MNDYKRPVEDLDAALTLLDHELSKVELDQPIQIRAIGGYALMKHGVRPKDRAFTVDIDTVTRDYRTAVQDAIHTVADSMGLERDWLNNENLGDETTPEEIETLYDAKWESQGQDLSNIDLAIGSVPTLTRAKIFAADAAEFSGRIQDVPDLIALLHHQGIESFAQYREMYPDPYDEFPGAHAAVAREYGAEYTPTHDDEDEYDDFWDDDPEETVKSWDNVFDNIATAEGDGITRRRGVEEMSPMFGDPYRAEDDFEL